MSDLPEPRRWADDPDAPRALAEAIRAARGAGPTAAQVDAVAKAAAGRAPLVSAASALRFAPAVGVAAVAAALWAARPGVTPPPTPRAPATVRAVTTQAPAPPPARLAPASSPATQGMVAPPAAARHHAVPAARAHHPRTACAEEALSARVSEATQAVLAGAYARALSIANDDAARCPDARSAEDRERVAIEALARLGRHDRARARLARFARDFPASLYLRRLRAMVGSTAP